MRFRSTLFLLLAVLVVGGGIWYLEHETVSTEEREEQARHALDIDPDDVRYLRVETTNQTVACRLVGSQWRIETPLKTHADKGEILRILTGLKNLPKLEVITLEQRREKGLRLHDYGLAVPRARMIVRQSDQEREILIGDTAAVGDTLYVMEANRDDVVATGQTLLDLLPKDLEILRSRKLIADPPYVLRRMEVRRASGFLLLANDAQRGWSLQQPVESRAHNGFVKDLINKLSTAEVSRFVEDEVTEFAPYGLGESVVHVAMWPVGGGSVRTLDLGSPDPTNPDLVFARVDDGSSVYGVSRQLYTDLMLDAEVFRDRRLLDVIDTRIAYIKVMEGDRTMELLKDDAGSWSLNRPRKRAADSTRVWDLLTGWSESRILEFVSDTATNLAEFGLSDPSQTVLLSVKAPEPEPEEKPEGDVPSPEGISQVTLHLYRSPTDAGRLFAQQEGSRTLMVTNPDVFPSVTDRSLWFYDRAVLQLAPGDIRKIELQDGNRHQVVQIDKEGGYSTDPDQEGEVAVAVAESILAEVTGLAAVRFVADDPEDLSPYGLVEPAATLTLGLSGDAGISKTLLFGSTAGEDGCYAMIRGQGAVFILAPDTCAQLLRDLVEIPPAAPEEPLVPPAETS